MSVRTMARVWESSMHSGAELLMLLAIADFADDDGNAYPAVQTLAKKCRITSRNVNRALAKLKKSGELEIRVNEGPKGTNRYRIVIEGMTRTPPLAISPSLARASHTPVIRAPIPLSPAPDEPSVTMKNHQKKVEQTVRTLLPEISDDLFADFAELRKARKAAITKTAIEGIRREAAKAGFSIEEAIRTCCERNWLGFKAGWLDNSNLRSGSPSGKAQPNQHNGLILGAI